MLKISLSEVLKALYGAYRLARFDAGGMTYFDTSIDGFWKSFFAGAIVAPLYLFFLLLRYQSGAIDAPFYRYISIEAIAYVIAWVVFPLVMVSVAKFLDREKKYLGYIVAYNWAAVWQNVVFLPIAILIVTGVLPLQTGSALELIVLIMVLFYVWFITRIALDVPGMTAAPLVALDLILGILVNGYAESMV